MIIKTEKDHIYRDSDSSALLNRNMEALKEYKLRKQQRSEFQQMADRLTKLEEVVEMLLSRLPD
jgi:Tfp pilus assembly protein PilO